MHNNVFYFLAMPTMGYQRVEANKQDNVFIAGIHQLASFSPKRLGVRLEAGWQVPLSSRWQLSAGMLYYQRRQTINYIEKMIDSMIVNSAGNEISLTPHFRYSDKTFEYNLNNIGLHVSINYRIAETAFLQIIGTGLEVHKGLRKPSDESLMREDPSLYLFYNLYYRIQYPSTGRLKAIFQPTLNYSFYLNENVNAPFYVKPYGLGLNLGFTYNL